MVSYTKPTLIQQRVSYTTIQIDFTTDASIRRSIIEYIYILTGGVVSQSSKFQRSISTLITKAKYRAFIYASKKIVQIQNLLSQLEKRVQQSSCLRYLEIIKTRLLLLRIQSFIFRQSILILAYTIFVSSLRMIKLIFNTFV